MSYTEDINLTNINGEKINPSTEDTIMYLKKIIQLLAPLATQDSNQRLRINIDGGTIATITTVSTLSNFGGTAVLPTVTNLTNLGGVDGRYLQLDTARLLYSEMIRKQLTF